MKYIYETNDEFNIIICTDDNGIISAIPKDEANSDYQTYLKWLDEQQASLNP